MTVDLVGDFDALVTKPAGHLGDRDAFGQRGRSVQMAQRVRDELRRQPGTGGGALEVLLIGAADDELVLPALEQVAVGRRAVLGISRCSPAWRNFSGLSCAAGSTCSLIRSVLPLPMRPRRLTARASPIRRPQPCMSHTVAAQSGGSPAATASTWVRVGRIKSTVLTTPGSAMPLHGDSRSFLSRTASAKTALTTK